MRFAGYGRQCNSVENEKQIPYTYGNLGLFLGAVCIACGVISNSTTLLGVGAAVTVLGGGYLFVVKSRRAKSAR